MSWRTTIRRTRQRQKIGHSNNDNWGNNSLHQQSEHNGDEQIGMHVRVLRYHEIRLGNIEKQLSNISRQLNNLGNSDSITLNSLDKNVLKNDSLNKFKKSDTDSTVNELHNVLKNLAEEVSSSNKMIKQFITNDKVAFTEPKTAINKITENVAEDEKNTISWKLAKTRLVRCGMKATDDRIRAMIDSMAEEVELVNDILDYNQETTISKQIETEVEAVAKDKIIDATNKHLEQTKPVTQIDTDSEEETINISTTNDIGYVPVHAVVKKKKGRPRKNNNNAK